MIYDFSDKLKCEIYIGSPTSGICTYKVKFQIFEMDERFRYRTSDKGFKAKNGLVIKSHLGPELNLDSVYLRGMLDHQDSNKPERSFHHLAGAVKYKDEIIEALKDWSINWEGWGFIPEAKLSNVLTIDPELNIPSKTHVCNWKVYQGLTETYKYCTICDKKKEI